MNFFLSVFHNGQSVQVGNVSVRAEDIQSLDIVRNQSAEQNNKKTSQQVEDESSVTKVSVHVMTMHTVHPLSTCLCFYHFFKINN